LIERLGQLSQTPITHRRSGKPGRGSSSRERDDTTSTGTALLAPLRPHPPGPSPSYGPPPGASYGPSYGSSHGSSHRGYETCGADDEPRGVGPRILCAAALVVVLIAGVFAFLKLGRSGSTDQPTGPVAASNPRASSGPPSSAVSTTPPVPTLTP